MQVTSIGRSAAAAVRVLPCSDRRCACKSRVTVTPLPRVGPNARFALRFSTFYFVGYFELDRVPPTSQPVARQRGASEGNSRPFALPSARRRSPPPRRRRQTVKLGRGRPCGSALAPAALFQA